MPTAPTTTHADTMTPDQSPAEQAADDLAARVRQMLTDLDTAYNKRVNADATPLTPGEIAALIDAHDRQVRDTAAVLTPADIAALKTL